MLPQLDYSNYLSQLFWLIIGFALLYKVVAAIFVPRIGVQLEKREIIIDNAKNRSTTLKREIDNLDNEVRAEYRAAKIQYEQLIGGAALAMKKRHDEELELLKQKITNDIRYAENEIEAKLQASSNEIKQQSRKVSELLIKKLMVN